MLEPIYSAGSAGLLGTALIGIGAVGIVIGFAWIRRITSGPDDGPSNWRSRR
jgi:hypothetical protein